MLIVRSREEGGEGEGEGEGDLLSLVLIVKEKKTDQPLVKSKWCVEKGLRRRFQWTGEFVVSSLIIRMIMRCTVGKAYGRQVWIADCGWWMVDGGWWKADCGFPLYWTGCCTGGQGQGIS